MKEEAPHWKVTLIVAATFLVIHVFLNALIRALAKLGEESDDDGSLTEDEDSTSMRGRVLKAAVAYVAKLFLFFAPVSTANYAAKFFFVFGLQLIRCPVLDIFRGVEYEVITNAMENAMFWRRFMFSAVLASVILLCLQLQIGNKDVLSITKLRVMLRMAMDFVMNSFGIQFIVFTVPILYAQSNDLSNFAFNFGAAVAISQYDDRSESKKYVAYFDDFVPDHNSS